MYIYFYSQELETQEGTLLFDYSKNLINTEIMTSLFNLVRISIYYLINYN